MTAININVEEFIKILNDMKEDGYKLINLDLIPDEGHPNMNKLVIYPVKPTNQEPNDEPKNIIVRNPEIRRDNNDIFNLFNDIL